MRYDDAIPEIGGKNLTQSRNSASAAAQLTNSDGRSMLPESLGIISKPTTKGNDDSREYEQQHFGYAEL